MDQQRRLAGLRRRSRRDGPAEAPGGSRRAEPVEDAAASGSASLTPVPPRLPGRRNPKWIALGVLAICLGGLLSYVVYAQVARQDTVLAMAATVYRGEVIEQADLTTVTVNGSADLATVSSSRLPELVGQRAAFDLVVGSVVTPESVRAAAVPASAHSIVGIKLDPGRAPTGYLVPGSTVRLVVVPPVNADPGFSDGYKDKFYPGVIVDTQPGPDAATLLVNLDVDNKQAALIAMLSASGRLAVVRDADR